MIVCVDDDGHKVDVQHKGNGGMLHMMEHLSDDKIQLGKK
jgi:hypothetical protein